MQVCRQSQPLVSGFVADGFEPVRQEFERNLHERGERGAAVCIYHHGQPVVDLWAGDRSDECGDAWTADTVVMPFSVTKGMAAAAMAVVHSRGWFELDAPVCQYWPEFGDAGKRQITVRQLLAHQAGLVGVDRKLNAQILADHDQMAALMARQRPLWRPGARHGYHTLTLGWYQSELIRRVDPQGRSLGVFFQQEIADPLGIEFYIGQPDDLGGRRIASLQGFHKLSLPAHLHELPAKMILAGIWPWSTVSRSIKFLRISDPAVLSSDQYRRVEIPSAGGIGTARAVAAVYDALLRTNSDLGIRPETIRELTSKPTAPRTNSMDAVMKIDMRYGMGFSRPGGKFVFGTDHRAFGCPGAGGSFGMADPTANLAYGYLTRKMGFRLFDDPREVAVRRTCYQCLDNLPATRRAA